jgi:hypothetical protein
MDSEKRRKMLCLIRSKACKKCGGDLSLECDVYGVYVQCIQCGANWTQGDLITAADRTPSSSRKSLAVKTIETTTPPR